MDAIKANAHLDQYFDSAWKHFDVMASGHVDAGMMPSFVRFLGGNQSGANVSSL